MSRFSMVVRCKRGVVRMLRTNSVLEIKYWCEFFDDCCDVIAYSVYDMECDYHLTQTNSYVWCRDLSKLKYGEV